MTKSVRLVVFDIAGTTVVDHGEIATAFQSAMKEYGYDIPEDKIYPLMGYKKTEAIRVMLESYEHNPEFITPHLIGKIHDYFINLMIGYYTETTELQPFPQTEAVFKYLKDRGILIGLDTGFSNDITGIIINRLGWLANQKVDYIVSSNEVPAGRPYPFMIKKIMNQAGITDSKNVVKIGDTEVDVQEGKNAGCLLSGAITTGAFTRNELEPYQPDFIIDQLDELIPIIENI